MGENGHTNGDGSATIPAVRTVTLPDSGKTVTLNYVSPLLLNDLRKAAQKGLTKPVPPTQEISGRTEANPLHPEYLAAQNEYNLAMGQRFLELLFKYGVADKPDAEAVAAFRANAEEDNLDLPADDRVLYVTRILVGGNGDVEALQEAIMGTGHPTERQVAAQVAAFPPEV